MADTDPQLGGVIPGEWFMKAIAERSPTGPMATIENQVELDAFRAEGRAIWERRRAKLTPEELELEDLKLELFCLEWGIS